MLVSALMVSIGAQWAVLQSAAWVRMAVSYSMEAGSVSEGLSRTFDGEHPCKLCCLVKKGTESEKKDSQQAPADKKIELYAGDREAFMIVAPAQRISFAIIDESASMRKCIPPVPPPRCVAS